MASQAGEFHKPAKTQAAVTGGGSALARYQDVIVGRRGWLSLLYFEFCAWLGPMPGALGLALRKIFWPRLFARCGRGVVFGPNITLRHANRIHLGERVVLSGGNVLDGRNDEIFDAITIGDDVILADGASVTCKGSRIRIGSRTGIGAQTILIATDSCPMTIGNDVAIAQQCYVIAGGTYHIDRLDVPIWTQGIVVDSGITIEDDVWFGAKVAMLSGSVVETGAIAAAGAVIRGRVPARMICGGVPARVLKARPGAEAELDSGNVAQDPG